MENSKISQKTTSKKALMAAIMYVINNFIIKAIGFLTVPIFSRKLSTEEYGIVSNFQSWASVLMIVLSLDLYSSIQRAKIDFEEKLDEYLSSILTLSSIVIVIVFIISNIFQNILVKIFDLDLSIINLLYVYIFFNCALDFYQMKHRVTLKYKQFTIISLTTSISSVILSLILVFVMRDKALARIIGIILPILIVSIFIYMIIMIKGKNFINISNWKYALKLSIPLIPHHLANNILAQSDKIVITKQLGYEKTALYAMGNNIASILVIIWNSLNNAWIPWFFEKMSKQKYEEIKKISKYYILIFAICIIGCLMITPEVIKIVAPKEYQSSIYVVPPILIGIMFQMLYSLYVNIEFYYKKNFYIPIGTVLSALINIFLNIILIPIFGYTVAAYTTLIGYFMLMIFHYIIARAIIKRKEILDQIFDLKYIKFVVFVMSIFAIIILKLYEVFILRYITIILISSFLLYIQRKQIKDLIKLVKEQISFKKNIKEKQD